MRVLHDFAELPSLPHPLAMAFGVFDGVHRGHVALIEAVLQRAAQMGAVAMVTTFDPHPRKVLAPEQAPLILTSTDHKLQIFSRLGINLALVLPFTRQLSLLTPEDFITAITSRCELRLIGVGHRWAFGHRRAGNVAMLEQLGRSHHFQVMELDPVTDENGVISSTRVRQALSEGRLDVVKNLLGRHFSIYAPVVGGEGRGRELGFPTMNLQPVSEKFPPAGVYAGHALLGSGRAYKAAIHIGPRPTVDAGPSLEAHLIGFEGDLVGQMVELFFWEKIRDVSKFESLEDLVGQIRKDVECAMKIVNLD